MIFPGDGEKKMYAQEEKVVWCVQEGIPPQEFGVVVVVMTIFPGDCGREMYAREENVVARVGVQESVQQQPSKKKY